MQQQSNAFQEEPKEFKQLDPAGAKLPDFQ